MRCSTTRLLRRAALVVVLAVVLLVATADEGTISSSKAASSSSSSTVSSSSSSTASSSSSSSTASSSSSSKAESSSSKTSTECDFAAFKEALVATTTPTTCAGGADGTLTARFAEGSGCASTLFTLSDGTTQRSAADGVFTGLRAGDYVLVARFSDTANAELQQTVGSATPLVFAVTAEDLNDGVCDACRSRANVSVSGGHAPYTIGDSEPNTVCPTSPLTHRTGGDDDMFRAPKNVSRTLAVFSLKCVITS